MFPLQPQKVNRTQGNHFCKQSNSVILLRSTEGVVLQTEELAAIFCLVKQKNKMTNILFTDTNLETLPTTTFLFFLAHSKT